MLVVLAGVVGVMDELGEGMVLVGQPWKNMVALVLMEVCMLVFFFFFQAEDGIRDDLVTGVQTCALPISICPLFLCSRPPLRCRSFRRVVALCPLRKKERANRGVPGSPARMSLELETPRAAGTGMVPSRVSQIALLRRFPVQAPLAGR